MMNSCLYETYTNYDLLLKEIIEKYQENKEWMKYEITKDAESCVDIKVINMQRIRDLNEGTYQNKIKTKNIKVVNVYGISRKAART